MDTMNSMSPRLFPNDLPNQTHAEKAEEVLNWVNRHSSSIHIDPSSRIPLLCRTVIKMSGHNTESDNPKHAQLVQSLKDVQEMWLIVRVFGDQLVAPPFRGPLIRSLKDNVIPAEDPVKSTQGRDAQFELFLAAIACRAGLVAAHEGEGQPDWIFATPLRRWSLEAKRVKSSSALKGHIDKASDQISNSSIGGIIAVDISAFDGIENRKLDQFVPDGTLADAREKMGSHIHEHVVPDLREKIGSRPVGLLIMHDFIICPAAVHTDGTFVPWGLHGFWFNYQFTSNGSQQYSRYQEFWEFFERCLPNL